MEYKKLTAPILLVGLSALFGFICFMLWVHGGNSKKWVARKMKVGGFILSLSSIASCTPFITTCYDMPAPNVFQFDQISQENYNLLADLPADSILTGTIYNRDQELFGFEILQNDSILVDEGNLIAVDGAFDGNEEKFEMKIDPEIPEGNYRLDVFCLDEQGEKFYEVHQQKLVVK